MIKAMKAQEHTNCITEGEPNRSNNAQQMNLLPL
jgi:hypothetical protein